MTLRIKIQHDEPTSFFGLDVETSNDGAEYTKTASLYPGDEPATVHIHRGKQVRLTEFVVSERPKQA